MSLIVTSFFTRNSSPETGLTPTLDIWEIDDTTNTLVVNDGVMSEIGDGFYKYVFTGQNLEKEYAIAVDGGPGLPPAERYAVAGVSELLTEIREGVFEAVAADYTTAGSVGLKINQIAADTAQLRLDLADMQLLVELLVKFEQNRTRIDKTARTLTIYDNDKVTPIHVFNLKDGTGAASVTEVCERDPV